MASVLQTFFKISLVLTLMILGMNVMLDVLAEPLTGQTLQQFVAQSNLARGDLNKSDLNTIAIGSEGGSTLKQSSATYDTPIWDISDFTQVHEAVLGFGGAYQELLEMIFMSVDDGTGKIVAIGRALRTLILAIQVIGLAYILPALWSTFKGGGAP